MRIFLRLFRKAKEDSIKVMVASSKLNLYLVVYNLRVWNKILKVEPTL